MRKKLNNIKNTAVNEAESLQDGAVKETEKLSTAPTEVRRRRKKSENDYYKVVCPFFIDLSGHCIRCEGIIPDTKVSTSFGNIRAMKKYRRVFCNTFDYEKCELCRVLKKKYD